MDSFDSLTWVELNHAAARQYAEACVVHRAWAEARAYYADLARTLSSHSETRTGASFNVLVQENRQGQRAIMGQRSREARCIAESFVLFERLARERLDHLSAALACHVQLNRALEVGEASDQVV